MAATENRPKRPHRRDGGMCEISFGVVVAAFSGRGSTKSESSGHADRGDHEQCGFPVHGLTAYDSAWSRLQEERVHIEQERGAVARADRDAGAPAERSTPGLGLE